MRIVILGDIGTPGEFHSGDEAMAEAAVHELARRLDITPVAISADPEVTTERYGWEAVARVGFGDLTSDVDRDRRLEAVERAAGGDVKALEWSDCAWGVVHAVAAADAVLITGGGNLNSSWPEHVYERAALGRIAATMGRPLVVSGQTVGPHLTGRHGELASQLLISAVLVGVREHASQGICRQLGVPDDRLAVTLDDATYLESRLGAPWVPPADRYIAATFAHHSGMVDAASYVEAAARLVARARDITGLDIALVPHQASTTPDARTVDVAIHDAIREAAGTGRIHSLPLQPGVEAAAARGAELVLSTRYHPVVFALGAGVPTIGIGTDAYTSTKIGGAMANWGAEVFALSSPSLINDDALRAVQDLWTRRDEVAQALSQLAPQRRAETSGWWDAVAAAVRGVAGATPRSLTVAEHLPGGDWSTATQRSRAWADLLSLRMSGTTLATEEMRVDHAELQRRVVELELEVSTLQSELDDAAEEASVLRESVRAAHELTEAHLDDITRFMGSTPRVQALTTELEALRNTRTFRYLQVPRGLWSRVRAARAAARHARSGR